MNLDQSKYTIIKIRLKWGTITMAKWPVANEKVGQW